MGRWDFNGFARGWFVVAFSDELKAGDVVPLRYFDHHQVLFRTESGQARVLDAFCPHLGAHLGHGGRVSGEAVVCPFHAWSFDGAGVCVDVPYASKIPKRARVEPWEVRERNGMIFVWHDQAGASPSWEIPEIQGHDTEEWSGWTWGLIEVKRHPREIVENVVDVAHFTRVHGTHVSEMHNEFDAHMATQVNTGTAYPVGGGKDHYTLRATYHGPAWQLTEMEGYLNSRLINAHTPLDEQTLHLRFAVSLKARDGKPAQQSFADGYVENLRVGFLQDIEIWENMRYRDQPNLCDGDGPIIKLRRWYSQFYESGGAA
jgi:3-ketosteroid 9alpha-monooxygenase subunit A